MKTGERWIVLLACLTVGVFYFWTIWSTGEHWKPGKEQRDYYNLLIDGYLSGQLNMKVEVPKALLELKDPYDPAQRPVGLGMHDASFYHGKYYVYFGAAPMILLMLPFRVITGMDLPIAPAVMIWVYAGFLASVSLWLAIRRRYFAEISAIVVVMGIFVLGLAGVGPVLLRRPDMWELPIAGGYCFAMLALYCVWRSLHSEQARGRWFGGAGLCLGLAIASRPTYLIASPFLAAPLIWWWWNERRAPWRPALRAAVALAIIGAAIAWHNYARFGHPLEFGQKYQFSLDYESKLPHFRLAYVPFTANAHFFSVAEWTKYYPFFHRALLGEAPAGFTNHRGDVYGLLTSFPITWLAALAPLAWWRRSSLERGRLAAWIASAFLLFAIATGLMLFFFSALARYQMDFAPTLLLLSCVGLLAVERWMSAVIPRAARGVVRAVWVAAAIFSIGFGVVFSLGFDGLFKERNPRLEHKVARVLNRVPAAIEQAQGVEFGPVEFVMRLPAELKSGRETLFTVGPINRLDRIFIQDNGDGHLQLGFAPAVGPERLSRPLALSRERTHRVRVSFHALYPPGMHPYYAGKTAEEVRATSRRFEVTLDDEPVLTGIHRAADLSYTILRAGKDAPIDGRYGRFRGEIESLHRLQTSAAIEQPSAFVRLRLALSSNPAAGAEPLLSLGERGAGITLAVTRTDQGRVRLTLLQSGASEQSSDLVAWVAGGVHEVVVTLESSRDNTQRLRVALDGQLVWAPLVSSKLKLATSPIAGRNAWAFPGCAEVFSGEIFSVQQDQRGQDPLLSAGSVVRIGLKWAGPTTRGSEPILATGRPGAGDILMVDYLSADTMQFVLDHWGSPIQRSKILPIDRSKRCELAITLPSLKTVPDTEVEGGIIAGRMRILLDGALIWEEEGEFFPAEPEEVAIGRNPVGGTISRPSFSGDIFSAERGPRE